MKKLEYMLLEENLDAEDVHLYLEKSSPNKSSWYKSLKTYTNSNSSNFISHWKSRFKQLVSGEIPQHVFEKEFFENPGQTSNITSKRCPGILGVLNNCYLVKSPVEIVIEIKDNTILQVHVSDSKYMTINGHGSNQFRSANNGLFNTRESVKFMLPVRLRTDVPYIFIDPFFHNNSGVQVVPGTISKPYNKLMELIVHCLVDTSVDRDIHIKPGDVIAYMWFPEKVNLKYSEKNMKDRRIKNYFNSTRKLIGN